MPSHHEGIANLIKSVETFSVKSAIDATKSGMEANQPLATSRETHETSFKVTKGPSSLGKNQDCVNKSNQTADRNQIDIEMLNQLVNKVAQWKGNDRTEAGERARIEELVELAKHTKL